MRPDDSVEGMLLMLALWVLPVLIGTWIDRRKAFTAYEQRRLEYSRKRLERIHNCEM